MTRAPRIAIVGGGIDGLAAALALERRGAEIVICEQSPALNEIGAGLNLSPNALMALDGQRRGSYWGIPSFVFASA
jgi:2-polyprenyl-6-methoxyphenol hydroxylase-like FAD-dependent oxidoreductase